MNQLSCFDNNILRKIIGYIPKKYYKNVSLTSKMFNEVICEIQKFIIPLKITEELLEQSNFNQLATTKRKFNEIIIERTKLNDENLELITIFLESHGSTINSLLINNDDEIESIFNVEKWINFLNRAQNLNYLDLRFRDLTMTGTCSHDNGFILQKLEKLSLDLIATKNIENFLFLLHPNSLKKLKVIGEFTQLCEFITRQTSIAELEISECNMHSSYFECLQLDTLILNIENEYFSADEFFTIMILQHSELKRILVRNRYDERIFYELSQELFTSLCNLRNLEDLELKFTVNNLNQLNMLENSFVKNVRMDISNIENENIPQIIEIKFMSIQEITMKSIYGIGRVIERIGEKWCNLTFLELDYCSENLNLNVFMEQLIHLKTCKLYFNNDEKSAIFHKTSMKFFNMENLVIQNAQSIVGFRDLLKALPHVKVLNFNFILIKYYISTLRVISKLKKLEQIEMAFKIYSPYTTAIRDCLLMLQKMFHQLSEICIEFNCPRNSNFNNSLVSFFESNDYIELYQSGNVLGFMKKK